MTIVQNGTVVEMNPGCIRKDVRNSWGITLADGSKMLFVWEHEMEPPFPTAAGEKWVNLFDPLDPIRRPVGGTERRGHVEAIMAGLASKGHNACKGWALIGFNIPDAAGGNHWWIERGDISKPYRIEETRTDEAGTIWGRLVRFEPRKPTPPYRRGYEVQT
jgi:hypothetical protein